MGIIEINGKCVVGVGSALVDILFNADDDFVKNAGGSKGGMEWVDMSVIDEAVKNAPEKPVIVPGGSACNTVTGIAQLGGTSRFVGKKGKDDLGKILENAISAIGMEPALISSDSPTGRVASIITPDAQRSMLTFLGASAELAPTDIDEAMFKDAAIIHVEGYQIYNKDLLIDILKKAKASKALVSLDLASYTIVEDAQDFIGELVKEYVDILIANEDEARAYTGISDEPKALEAMGENVLIAALKVGSRGSSVLHDGRVTQIKPVPGIDAIDTTGAGDLWAAGFLYGLVEGFSMEKCGEIASVCGGEVCKVIGASIPDEKYLEIKKSL